MGAIQPIFHRFGPEHLARFGEHISTQHHKIIEAICQCCTEAYGSVCYQCEDCGHPHVLPAACGNRHCPQCQHRKTQQWLERGLQRQLPGHHFMLTFTVPEPLRAFLRSHQELGYDALFAASSQAIKALVHDPRFLGADRAGFFGVLHTWGRQLQYHPHIHYVVPGGALSSEDGAWYASSPSFFLPVKALARLFRGKFRALIRKAALLDQIPSETWQKDWNVNCQAVPNAEASTLSRPLRLQGGHLGSPHPQGRGKRCLLLLQKTRQRSFEDPHSIPWSSSAVSRSHVLPKGFMKVRYYGFLSPTAKVPLEDIKVLVELAHGFTVTVPEIELPPWPQPNGQEPGFYEVQDEPICQACGGRLRFHSAVRTPRSTRLLPMSVGPPASTALPANG